MWRVAVRAVVCPGGYGWVGVGAASRVLSRRRLLAISAAVRSRRRVFEAGLASIVVVGGGSGLVRRCVCGKAGCVRVVGLGSGLGPVSRVPSRRRLLAKSAAIWGRRLVFEMGLAAIEAVGGCSGSGAAVCVGRPVVGEV